MKPKATEALHHQITLLNENVTPFELQDEKFYRNLMNKIGNASIVLLGESTHGTKEFYLTRMEISKRLITEKNFNVIAVEADWTSAYQIQRFIHASLPNDPQTALNAFQRFPAWMWSNEIILTFIKWLRIHNEKADAKKKVRFYGLDLYCLNEAMQAVIEYLNKVDPEAAEEAKKRYACFDHARLDPQKYGYRVEQGLQKSCIREVNEQMFAMQQLQFAEMQKKIKDEDELFYAQQNARVVKNAEEYYRSLFESREVSWNLRDQHMAQTVNELKDHLQKQGKPTKMIIWAHNSHIGDARATEAADRDELNLGQLLREQYPNDTYLLGFSTYQGTVTAANDWGDEPKTMKIQPGLRSSYEELFHQVRTKNFFLDLHTENLQTLLNLSRLQRAIGVIYRPQTERISHYFFTQLAKQFDGIIHIDTSSSLTPLDIPASTSV